ncbi:MAG: response regulator [Cyclobacteriaceae bacterium]|nr:response regulator [Cyclobacteriaceae bacterium]
MNNFGPLLIAEDNDMDLELALEALKSLNLANEIAVVRDGVEALDFLYCRGEYKDREPLNPVVALLDIKMPKVTGIEVLETIKKDKDLQNIPIVMLTSSSEDIDVRKCYDLGANAFVVKPVDFDQFNSAVKEIGLFWGVSNKTPN